MKAPNRGPFTLDGTRTFLVGRREAAVIDPGPDVETHVRAVSLALTGASRIRILLTHHHGDHAGGARALARLLDAPLYGPPSTDTRSLEPGMEFRTDAGTLVAHHTPGHTRDHLTFFWPEARALFVGDVVLGRGNTTWLGEYPGCVADYLESLDRLEALAPEVLYPAHGNPIRDVARVLEAYRGHRMDRLRQLAAARKLHPRASPDDLFELIYGEAIPDGVRKAALASIRVMLHHLEHA